MARKIQFRRGTAASWTSTDPTLAIGELGLETDTGKIKIGDGVTAWSARPYIDAAALAHIADTSAAHAAASIASTPAGTLAATDVQAALNELDTEKAPLASPALTGTPTAPTAATATNTTQVATTAFVRANRAEQAAADISQFLPWLPNTAYTTGKLVSRLGVLYRVTADHTSPAVWDGTNLGVPIVPDAGSATEALNRQTADDRYVRTNGAWTSWTPIATSLTPGATPPVFGTIAAAYEVKDRTMRGRFNVALTTKGTATGFAQLTLPTGSVTAAGYGGSTSVGTFYEANAGVNGFVLCPAGGSVIYLILPAGATPFTADGRQWRGSFELELGTLPS